MNRPLNEYDLYKYAIHLKIKYFRHVFMRDNLPMKPHRNECAIVNLDSIDGSGTHWVAYCKKNDSVYYYDSFGDLPPPIELANYFRSGGDTTKIYYNYLQYQNYNTYICGQLCLNFLHHFNKYYK
jgi:hypothetical protein